jgi:hypothetical protein
MAIVPQPGRGEQPCCPTCPTEPDAAPVAAALAAPFDASEVKFKPAVVSGNRALALAYVDARAIQDRLDEVLGVMGWQDSYRVLPDGSVMCRLRLRIGDQWITKVDVGGQSEQPDGGDRTKAAFSDALKRAAVKFGVGRYLYRLPQQWCDYDPHKRQFVRTPSLPPWALPAQATIGAEGVLRLRALADRKGVGLEKYTSPINRDPEALTREQGNAVMAKLKTLPDVPPPAANGQAAK